MKTIQDKTETGGGKAPRKMTVREWKDACEIREGKELRRYHEILTNANFVLANSTQPELRAFAQIIINISERP